MGVRGEVYQSFEMGSMFSKKKKAAADEEPRTHSAPAALEQWAGGSSPKDGRPSPTANQDRPSTAQETLMATRTGGGAGTQLAAAASAADAPPARPANPSPRTPTHGGANIHNNAASAAPIADSQVAAHHTVSVPLSRHHTVFLSHLGCSLFGVQARLALSLGLTPKEGYMVLVTRAGSH